MNVIKYKNIELAASILLFRLFVQTEMYDLLLQIFATLHMTFRATLEKVSETLTPFYYRGQN